MHLNAINPQQNYLHQNSTPSYTTYSGHINFNTLPSPKKLSIKESVLEGSVCKTTNAALQVFVSLGMTLGAILGKTSDTMPLTTVCIASLVGFSLCDHTAIFPIIFCGSLLISINHLAGKTLGESSGKLIGGTVSLFAALPSYTASMLFSVPIELIYDYLYKPVSCPPEWTTQWAFSNWHTEVTQKPENRHLAKEKIWFYFKLGHTELSMPDLHLTSLPDIFHDPNFQRPTILEAGGNNLTSLPQSLEKCKNIKRLNLQHNKLSEFPIAFLSFPSSCVINVEHNHFPINMLRNLHKITQRHSYQGPRIYFSLEEKKEDIRTTQELLQSMAIQTNKSPPVLCNFLETHAPFRKWLIYLSYIADHSTLHVAKTRLLENVLRYVGLALENEIFYNLFLKTIEKMPTVYDDSVVLSLLYLEIYSYLATTKPTNLKKILELLQGIHSLYLLEDTARTKIKNTSIVDEIKLYLTYPLQLKEALSLPIEVYDMLNFGCDLVSQEELEQAKDDVLLSTHSHNKRSAFLITQEPWLRYLSTIPNNKKDLTELTKQIVEGCV